MLYCRRLVSAYFFHNAWNFSVSAGSVVPASVTLVDMPPEIVRIVPAWRSYKVIRVKNEIVIVDPSTRKIVEVITIRT